MNSYFITGTDTDCGKTYVTRKLLEFVSKSIAIKPVASGCFLHEEELISADAQQLQYHNCLSLEQINPWRFPSPISPHIAAREQKVSIIIKELADYCLNFKMEPFETLFIEGAGGLMVPLNDKETWIDFLKLTKIPVILVVGLKLGCINHALLTASALDYYNIPCAGWIANCLYPNMLALDENIETLKEKLSFPLITQIPYGGAIQNPLVNFK